MEIIDASKVQVKEDKDSGIDAVLSSRSIPGLQYQKSSDEFRDYGIFGDDPISSYRLDPRTQDLPKLRAQAQGTLTQLGYTVTKAPYQAFGKFLETMGHLSDLTAYDDAFRALANDQSSDTPFSEDYSDVGNWLSKVGKATNTYFDELFPVYREDPEKTWAIGDPAWWFSNVGDTAESIASFGGASALVKGAGQKVLGHVLKKGIQRGAAVNTARGGAPLARASQKVNQFGTNFAVSYAEGMMTGMQQYESTYNRVKQELTEQASNLSRRERKQQKLTEEQIEQRAKQAGSQNAAYTAGLNSVILPFLNWTGTSTLFRRGRNANRAINQGLRSKAGEGLEEFKSRVKDFTPPTGFSRERNAILRESGLESVEELANEVAGSEGEYKALRDQGLIDKKDLSNRLVDTLMTPEAALSATLGALGGAGQHGIMSRLPTIEGEDGRISQAELQRKRHQEAAISDKKYLTNKIERIIEAKEKIQSEDETERQQGFRMLDTAVTADGISRGLDQELLGYYNEIENLSKEEAENLGYDTNEDSDTYYKKIAQRQKEKTNWAKNLYNDLLYQYDFTGQEEFAGIPKALLTLRIQEENAKDDIEAYESRIESKKDTRNELDNLIQDAYELQAKVENLEGRQETYNEILELFKAIKETGNGDLTLAEIVNDKEFNENFEDYHDPLSGDNVKPRREVDNHTLQQALGLINSLVNLDPSFKEQVKNLKNVPINYALTAINDINQNLNLELEQAKESSKSEYNQWLSENNLKNSKKARDVFEAKISNISNRVDQSIDHDLKSVSEAKERVITNQYEYNYISSSRGRDQMVDRTRTIFERYREEHNAQVGTLVESAKTLEELDEIEEQFKEADVEEEVQNKREELETEETREKIKEQEEELEKMKSEAESETDFMGELQKRMKENEGKDKSEVEENVVESETVIEEDKKESNEEENKKEQNENENNKENNKDKDKDKEEKENNKEKEDKGVVERAVDKTKEVAGDFIGQVNKLKEERKENKKDKDEVKEEESNYILNNFAKLRDLQKKRKFDVKDHIKNRLNNEDNYNLTNEEIEELTKELFEYYNRFKVIPDEDTDTKDDIDEPPRNPSKEESETSAEDSQPETQVKATYTGSGITYISKDAVEFDGALYNENEDRSDLLPTPYIESYSKVMPGDKIEYRVGLESYNDDDITWSDLSDVESIDDLTDDELSRVVISIHYTEDGSGNKLGYLRRTDSINKNNTAPLPDDNNVEDNVERQKNINKVLRKGIIENAINNGNQVPGLINEKTPGKLTINYKKNEDGSNKLPLEKEKQPVNEAFKNQDITYYVIRGNEVYTSSNNTVSKAELLNTDSFLENNEGTSGVIVTMGNGKQLAVPMWIPKISDTEEGENVINAITQLAVRKAKGESLSDLQIDLSDPKTLKKHIQKYIYTTSTSPIKLHKESDPNTPSRVYLSVSSESGDIHLIDQFTGRMYTTNKSLINSDEGIYLFTEDQTDQITESMNKLSMNVDVHSINTSQEGAIQQTKFRLTLDNNGDISFTTYNDYNSFIGEFMQIDIDGNYSIEVDGETQHLAYEHPYPVTELNIERNVNPNIPNVPTRSTTVNKPDQPPTEEGFESQDSNTKEEKRLEEMNLFELKALSESRNDAVGQRADELLEERLEDLDEEESLNIDFTSGKVFTEEGNELRVFNTSQFSGPDIGDVVEVIDSIRIDTSGGKIQYLKIKDEDAERLNPNTSFDKATKEELGIDGTWIPVTSIDSYGDITNKFEERNDEFAQVYLDRTNKNIKKRGGKTTKRPSKADIPASDNIPNVSNEKEIINNNQEDKRQDKTSEKIKNIDIPVSKNRPDIRVKQLSEDEILDLLKDTEYESLISALDLSELDFLLFDKAKPFRKDEARGSYNRKQNYVAIYRQEALKKGGPSPAEVIAHEIVHHVTMKKATKKENENKIKPLINNILDSLTEEDVGISRASEDSQYAGSSRLLYGLTGQIVKSVDEVERDKINITEIPTIFLTNRKIQNWARSKKSINNKSVWENIINALKRIVGIKQDEESLYEEILANLATLIDENKIDSELGIEELYIDPNTSFEIQDTNRTRREQISEKQEDNEVESEVDNRPDIDPKAREFADEIENRDDIETIDDLIEDSKEEVEIVTENEDEITDDHEKVSKEMKKALNSSPLKDSHHVQPKLPSGWTIRKVFRDNNAAGIKFSKNAQDPVEHWVVKMPNGEEFLFPSPKRTGGFREIGASGGDIDGEQSFSYEVRGENEVIPVKWKGDNTSESFGEEGQQQTVEIELQNTVKTSSIKELRDQIEKELEYRRIQESEDVENEQDIKFKDVEGSDDINSHEDLLEYFELRSLRKNAVSIQSTQSREKIGNIGNEKRVKEAEAEIKKAKKKQKEYEQALEEIEEPSLGQVERFIYDIMSGNVSSKIEEEVSGSANNPDRLRDTIGQRYLVTPIQIGVDEYYNEIHDSIDTDKPKGKKNDVINEWLDKIENDIKNEQNPQVLEDQIRDEFDSIDISTRKSRSNENIKKSVNKLKSLLTEIDNSNEVMEDLRNDIDDAVFDLEQELVNKGDSSEPSDKSSNNKFNISDDMFSSMSSKRGYGNKQQVSGDVRESTDIDVGETNTSSETLENNALNDYNCPT